ncbi:hypothetical protein U1Q18_030134 [Sarracenia purpurea var. burkii]
MGFGEAVFELEQILRSKQEILTSQEANVLMKCKALAIKELTIGAAAGGGIAWLATQRLSHLVRINLSAGTGALCAVWRFGNSLDTNIGHILSLDGSKIQKELANIILKRYGDDQTAMQLISKHFYSEKVFDDSCTDQPKVRWRYRNFFGDNVAYSQNTRDGDSYGDKTDSAETDAENTEELKRVIGNTGWDSFSNPLDYICGIPGSSEEIHHNTSSGTSSKKPGRSYRRSRRRHRMRHHDVS